METESQDEEIIVINKVEFLKFIKMFEDFQRKYCGDKLELNLGGVVEQTHSKK